MPPFIASLIFTTAIFGLFYFDRDKEILVSKSLWIPTAWLFFCLSRSFSQWLGLSPADAASTYVEGSPIDAAVYEAIEILALIVVIGRRQRVVPLLRRNWAICLFFSYAALSLSWSDYPFVTLKHWIKGVGDVMMILIVLTEASVPDALKRLFTRLAFVLVPLSVLFVKYYPQLGRLLTLSWNMDPVGVATQKNGLGELCDFLGLALLWRFRSAWSDRNDPNRIRRLSALGAVLAMVVWLLWQCNSMTSICALSMASTAMLLSTKSLVYRKRSRVHLLVSTLVACALYALFFQSSGSLIKDLGRNPTLTGRTEIWHAVFTVVSNPLVGAGYESFWLGSRLEILWRTFPNFYLQEAHNGYIELYLNLGWVGIVLLGILIVMGYRNIIDSYRRNPHFGALKLALFVAAIVTGLTEAAFRMMGPPWVMFLLATTGTTAYAEHKVRARRESKATPDLPTLATAVPEEALTSI